MTVLWTWNLKAFAAALLLYHGSEFALAAVYMRHELGWSCECVRSGDGALGAAWRAAHPIRSHGS